MLCTNFCDEVTDELKTWYSRANGRSQKDELHEINQNHLFSSVISLTCSNSHTLGSNGLAHADLAKKRFLE